jgi:hypothetical protein
VRVKEPPPLEGRTIDINVEVPEGCTVARIEPASVLVFKESARKVANKTKGEKNSKRSSR